MSLGVKGVQPCVKAGDSYSEKERKRQREIELAKSRKKYIESQGTTKDFFSAVMETYSSKKDSNEHK